MKWDEINDPRDAIEIRATFSKSIGKFYTPEQIQTLVDEHGTEVMVEMVNKHLLAHNVYSGLMLVETNNKKTLIDYTATLETNVN